MDAVTRSRVGGAGRAVSRGFVGRRFVGCRLVGVEAGVGRLAWLGGRPGKLQQFEDLAVMGEVEVEQRCYNLADRFVGGVFTRETQELDAAIGESARAGNAVAHDLDSPADTLMADGSRGAFGLGHDVGNARGSGAVAVFRFDEGGQHRLAVEHANVFGLYRRDPAHGPDQLHVVGLVRRPDQVQPDFSR